MFCNNCGHNNPLGSNFCSSCGAVIDPGPGEPNTVTFQMEAIPGGEDATVEVGPIPTGGVMIVKRGSNAGARYPLDKDLVTAGRHPDSDIFLDDVTVSRRHVEMYLQGETFHIRDVGSLNGTYVNRERIEESELTSGDEVQIGKFKLLYIVGGD